MVQATNQPFKNLGDLLPSTDLSWLMVQTRGGRVCVSGFWKSVRREKPGAFISGGVGWEFLANGTTNEWWLVILILITNALILWYIQIAMENGCIFPIETWGYSIAMLVYQRLNLWSNDLEILDSRLNISIKIHCVLTDEHPEVYISILYFWSVVRGGRCYEHIVVVL